MTRSWNHFLLIKPCTGHSELLVEPNTTETSEDDPWDIHYLICYYCLIPVTIFILLFNTPVIVSIVYNRRLHFATFFYILSLASADFLVGIMCFGKLIAPQTSSYTTCLLRYAFVISPVCASVWFMFWVALDRYLGIRSPLTYQLIMTNPRAAFAIATTWICSFIIGFAPLMGWNLGNEDTRCSFLYIVPSSYVWFLFFTAFSVPIVINVVIYIKIFLIARKHIKDISIMEISVSANRVSATDNPESSDEQNITHRNSFVHYTSLPRTLKAVKTLAIVLGCFLLTWGPFAVVNVVQLICGYDTCDLRDLTGTYLLLLGFCTCFLNPLIYGFWNKDFRTILKESCVKAVKNLPSRNCLGSQRRISNIPSDPQSRDVSSQK